jgi:hypothetical protein
MTDTSSAAVAQVATGAEKIVWREGGQRASATLTEGYTVSAYTPKEITKQDAFVGAGKNNADLFSCWRKF